MNKQQTRREWLNSKFPNFFRLHDKAIKAWAKNEKPFKNAPVHMAKLWDQYGDAIIDSYETD